MKITSGGKSINVRGFIDKPPSDEDKATLTKLLNECYKHTGTFYDISNRVIGTDFIFTDPKTLEAGETAQVQNTK